MILPNITRVSQIFKMLTILNLFLASVIQPLPIKGSSVSTFYNVIVQSGADPWVYLHTDGFYYMTRTTGGNVQLWRSHSFTSIDAGDTISLWNPSGSGPACTAVWAPEIHFIHSAW